MREKGIDFVRFGWLGICAAKGTPEPIIKTLHDKIVPIVAMPEYRALIENGGPIAISSTPEELAPSSAKPRMTLRRASKNSACSRTSEQ